MVVGGGCKWREVEEGGTRRRKVEGKERRWREKEKGRKK